MKTSKIVKKLKQAHLLTRIWFWAAVRSRYFLECKLSFSPPLVAIEFVQTFGIYEFLRIQISFNRPKLTLYIPCEVGDDFFKATNPTEENMGQCDIDAIPF